MLEYNNEYSPDTKASMIDAPFPLVLIEGLYTEEELFLIHQELDYLHIGGRLKYEGTGASLGTSANREGVWLKEVYKELEYSNIHCISRKVLKLIEHIKTDEWFFSNMEVFADSTLVSYYTEGGSYEAHRDLASITAVHWTHKGDKPSFSGGEIHFPDYNITLSPTKSTIVLFPSCISHEVLEVRQGIEDDVYNKYGRYAITHFMSLYKIAE
jgi:hypothetical protein